MTSWNSRPRLEIIKPDVCQVNVSVRGLLQYSIKVGKSIPESKRPQTGAWIETCVTWMKRQMSRTHCKAQTWVEQPLDYFFFFKNHNNSDDPGVKLLFASLLFSSRGCFLYAALGDPLRGQTRGVFVRLNKVQIKSGLIVFSQLDKQLQISRRRHGGITCLQTRSIPQTKNLLVSRLWGGHERTMCCGAAGSAHNSGGLLLTRLFRLVALIHWKLERDIF